MQKISAVIISLNEERNIQRAIDSLKPVADEILVYDSHSSDKTPEICHEAGVRFLQGDWLGYAATKNKANALATHNYILPLDADEALSETLQQSILKARQKGLQGAYKMNRLTNYCGQWIYHSGWYPDQKHRLFPKNQVQWKGEWVHEVPDIPTSLNVQHLEGDILHYSYYSVEEHWERARHYAELKAQQFKAKGKKAGFFKPYLSAFWRFISMYFLKKGFLDGSHGWKIAQIAAWASYYQYRLVRKK